jgi:hypothetical protein
MPSDRKTVVIRIQALGDEFDEEPPKRAVGLQYDHTAVLPDSVQVLELARWIALIP